MGTKLPWDSKWIIEPLSDSTIYMAYYTISRHIKEIGPDRLVSEFFDYVFLGVGDEDVVSEKTGLPPDKLKEIRDEFISSKSR